MNPANVLVSCAAFTSTKPAEASNNTKKTRGAYIQCAVGLVTASGGDAVNLTLKYALAETSDLALAPALQQNLPQWRDKVVKTAG